MEFHFRPNEREFWKTFDELAGLPNPRRALGTFFGLSIAGTVAVVFGIATVIQLSNLAIKSVGLGSSGAESLSMITSVISVALGCVVWINMMFKVRDMAFILGGAEQ